MRFVLGVALAMGALLVWSLPGCTTDQEPSDVICQPSQLVRCNSCPMTGRCADTVCQGWLQCSSDGTAFMGTCSECAPYDSNADSCASLQTCCAQSSLPGSDRATCAGIVMANNADNCYALLDQYIADHSCGGVANPPPPPPEGGVVSGACADLAPCCDAPGHSPQAAGACSALVSQANDAACADANHLYCSHPGSDGGCSGSSCQDGETDGATGDGGTDGFPVDSSGDSFMSDVVDEFGGDGGFGDSGCPPDAELCDSGTP